jgi:hypothetical protein
VYTTDAIDNLIQERVADLAAVFALDTATSVALLLQYQFSGEKVTAAMVADRTKALATVGASDSPVDPKLKRNKAESLECSICFQQSPMEKSLALTCGHGFCRECWVTLSFFFSFFSEKNKNKVEHLRARLDEGGSSVALARCAWQGCQCVVPATAWEDLMTNKEVSRYRAAVREQFAMGAWKDWKV